MDIDKDVQSKVYVVSTLGHSIQFVYGDSVINLKPYQKVLLDASFLNESGLPDGVKFYKYREVK